MKIQLHFARLLAVLFLSLMPVFVSAQVDDDDEDDQSSRVKLKPISDDEEEEDEGSDFLYNHRAEIGMHVSAYLKEDDEGIGAYYGPTFDWIFLNAPFKLSTGLNVLKAEHRYAEDYWGHQDTDLYYNMAVNYFQVPLLCYVRLSDEESPRCYLGGGVTLNYKTSITRTEMFDYDAFGFEPRYGRIDNFRGTALTELGYSRLSLGIFAGFVYEAEVAKDFSISVQPYLAYAQFYNDKNSNAIIEQPFVGMQFRLAYNILSAF